MEDEGLCARPLSAIHHLRPLRPLPVVYCSISVFLHSSPFLFASCHSFPIAKCSLLGPNISLSAVHYPFIILCWVSSPAFNLSISTFCHYHLLPCSLSPSFVLIPSPLLPVPFLVLTLIWYYFFLAAKLLPVYSPLTVLQSSWVSLDNA